MYLNVSKENNVRNLIFPQYKMFTSLEFRLSAVVTWQELGLKYCGATALARNVRIKLHVFIILHKQPS